jgi:ribosomal small subunit protein bTHX
MGKGDLKSRRGKLVNGSYGVRRRKNKSKPVKNQVTIKRVEGITEKPPVAVRPKTAPRKKKEA